MAKRLSLLDFQKTAEAKGGQCLTSEYINLDQLMEWKCENGHVFISRAEDVRRGSWCRKCSDIKNAKKRKEKFFKKVVDYAKKMEGECLSKEYVSKDFKMQMKCKSGHIWWSRPHDLLRNHWCPYCSKNVKLTIEDCQKIAASKNGECLSKVYKNSQTKLIWKCHDNHIWKAATSMVNYGTWCPYCKNKTENICRDIFEEIYNKKFIKLCPKWLIGINNFPLELDGYCEELNIAFEYNGEQHYKPVNFFGGNEKFKIVQENDKVKKELCHQKNVKLYVIKYMLNPTKDKLKKQILKLIKEK